VSRGPGAVGATAAAISGRRASSVDAVSECLRRIDSEDAPINAVVALRADEAVADARAIDARLARGEDVGPLAGVPVLVKDYEDVAGMRTRRGSVALRDVAPASADEVVPALLRRAGAVIVGKTNLPEFAVEGFTDNLLDGATRNPWSLEWTPGGSSGGSGAALAAGLAPIATGTDGGGSVRIPAGACGLVGLKPTHGAVGRWPVADWIDYSTYGPMATTVDDMRLLFELMRGVVAGDPSSARFPSGAPGRDARPSHILAAERTAPMGPLPAAVAEGFWDAVARAGALWDVEVTTLDPEAIFGDVGDPDHDWFTVAPAEHVASLGRAWVLEHMDELHPSSQAYLGAGLEVSIDVYHACRRRRAAYTYRLDTLLGEYGVLLTPTLAVEGLLADGRLSASSPFAPTGPEVYSTAIQNITGHPAVSVPAGIYASGVPYGLQLTTARWSDDWLLDLAAQWEAAHPWVRTAPGYPEFSLD
jgi:amidase/aspartyl-tRNA(Asn)/glutamyl-tRNA(Gln) amidotransferase subunit A